MAYSGYLIKVGGSNGTELPFKYIKASGYSITPNQRMESEAKRDVTGVLHRTTVAHTATKIEFNTPVITNRDVAELNTLIQTHFTDSQERKIVINYYDQETDSYKNATCYMPDVSYTISHIETATNTIYYEPVRFAFIEY